ncbi:sodium-coupled monocarboxylate transporter 1-like [Odontesthes bonariensis]|uniref:sodium-coupled monocarboxylate transporter 1-like n=1 Tax=Odontesthes bonariensis TaxID=219752 RepID=UPI003F5827F6
MSGHLKGSGSFGVEDYVVFALMLLVSTGIGLYHAWVDRNQRGSRNFLTGGRTLTALPVALSLTASTISSVMVLSNPAEVYCFGAIFGLGAIAFTVSMVITSEIFLPIFYRLGVTSSYEYLELRFNRATRLLGMAFCIIQTILFAGVTVYGPALALNQVIGMDLWVGISSTAIVCTFYCTLGGLKAVVWTDVFQVVIMLSGYLAVVVKAVIVRGGVSTILSDAQRGGRLNFWDFDMNPLRRHTFWTLAVGGSVFWSCVFGISPPSVQRYASCRSVTHARLAVFINLLGLCSFLVCTVFSGLCLYSVYQDCDPWTSGRISSPDQLMPYLVMDILTDTPSLPGLFLAAVYSCSLSTVSTCINALAAVTLEDLIKPCIRTSEKHQLIISKGLSCFYGVLCIAIAGMASNMGEMMQAVATVTGVTGGPLLGLFSLGMLCPFANSKGALSGLASGFVATLCVSLGEMMSPSPPEMTRPLSLTTEGCNFTPTALPLEQNSLTGGDLCRFPLTVRHLQLGKWQSPSYLYFSLIGAVVALTVGSTVSLLTGGQRQKVEPRLTFQKEDTTFYQLFKFVKDNVTRRAETHELTKRPEGGNTNPAFCDSEIHMRGTS